MRKLAALAVLALVTPAWIVPFAACSGKADPPAESPDAGVDAAAFLPPRPTVRDSGKVYDAQDDWAKVDEKATSTPVTLDLGDVLVDQDIPFVVPANTLGFNVSIQTTTPDRSLEVVDVKSPDGQAAVAGGVLFNGDHATSNTLFGDVAAAAIPGSNHPSTMPTVVPGTWKVKFGGRPGRAKVQLQTTPDGLFHGGYVDMHVYLAKGLTIDGDTVIAENYAAIQGARDRIDAMGAAIHALYGLDRGNVTFHLIDASYVTVDDAHLAALFKQTKAGGDGQAMHIFMVEPTTKQQWWGISGGVPGAATSSGTTESAIALAMLGDADIEGTVLAHEMGHFFGLSHTSEFGGGGFDPLEDTAKCPDLTQSKIMQCPDLKNVMFAAGSATGIAESSPLQRRVVQGSPVYRAFLTGTAPAPKAAKGGDTGALFGHPGVPPTGAEIVVLGGLCGHPSHAARAADLARATSATELQKIAELPRANPVVRERARALAALIPR